MCLRCVIVVGGVFIVVDRVVAATHRAVTLDENVVVLDISAICFVVTLGPMANDPFHGTRGEQVFGDSGHGIV